MADELNMDKHFEMAGIVDDPKPEDKQTESNSNVQQPESQEQNKQPQTEGSTKDVSEQTTGKDQQQKPAEQDKQSGKDDGDGKQKETEFRKNADTAGNLKLQDGTEVKAGGERRWYERYDLARRDAGQAKTDLHNTRLELNKLNDKVKQYEEAAQQAGVADPTQMSTALKLYKDLASNPVETIKKLVVEAKSKGYSIEGLGADIDTAAINRILDQRLQPTVDANKEAEETQRVQQEAVQEAERFFTANPDARIHEPLIAALIPTQPDATLFEIYSALKLSAIDNGFDWSKDLRPQIDARRNQAPQQQQQMQQQPRPMVNGDASAVDKGVLQGHDPNKVPVQADTIEDAVIAGMRDAGINYKR